MAVLKMKNIRIAVANKDLKKCVSFLQKAGVVEIKQTEQLEGFGKKDYLSQRLTFERMVSTAENALEILNKKAPEKKGMLSFLNGRKEIDEVSYQKMVSKSTSTIMYCYDIVSLEKQYSDECAEIGRITIEIDELDGWRSLDMPTGFKGTKHTACFIGSFAESLTAGEIASLLQEKGYEGTAEIEVVSSSKIQTNVFISCLKSDAEQLESVLRKCGYNYVSSPSATLVPVERIKELELRKNGLEADSKQILLLIEKFSTFREEIEFFVDYYSSRAKRYELYGDLKQSENTAIIDGYIPEKFAEKIQENLEEKFAAAVEITDPEEDEEVPVALSNNSLTRPCESLVSMYSMPSKNDVDPTSPMAFFFYIFFGMMLSDAGYGLLIVLGCTIGLLKFNLEDNWKNNLKMFLFCGISTCFWGILFGGFFGDLIPQIASTYFGKTIAMPKLLDPISDALPLLILGIAMGVVHIYYGMALNFYNLCRRGKVLDAIFDVGLWFVTLTGAVVAIVGAMGGYSNITPYGLYILAAGAVGLVLTQGRNNKGAGKVIGGIASLYDITSYASDMLSYSRLMALGLATGVFAQVINQLGIGTGVVGVIKFVIIFVIGNAISFAMNALGAYVHTIRLQYVEFFGKFYEGGGKEFKPFNLKTKFFRLKK
ncbi:MAG: V-type ATP synthase subunit I [Clostridia bacterium]|nr:V-type ATP synthase subunit I [Clostridia bacterium]